jgi:tRNA G18 (ribose-2'-O)-methylase SpoU
MPIVESLDDPRLAAYRNLKDHELARSGGRFIAEGEQVVRRLLGSSIPVESILVSERKAGAIAPLAPAGVPVWVASDAVIQGVIGFQFHSGVMAVGLRRARGGLGDVLDGGRGRQTIVICPNITNTQNLGSLIRLCAGFGVDALVLGESCCDPFFRHSVRVSMGSVFKLPLVESGDLKKDLGELRARWGFELIASVVAEDAEALAGAGRGARVGILFGNEAYGLSAEHVQACARRVTIPMRMGTDSLNVAVAAGIFLYHFVDQCGGASLRF